MTVEQWTHSLMNPDEFETFVMSSAHCISLWGSTMSWVGQAYVSNIICPKNEVN